MAEDLVLSSGTYRVGRFKNAIEQLQVARKLSPVLVKMGSLVELFERVLSDDAPAFIDLKEMMADVAPFAEALADLPDDRFEYIVKACFGVCQRQTGAGGGFSPVMAGGQQMFADITMTDTMQLVFAVIKENLSDFSAGLPSTS